jgi:glutathione peroxidase-family protein
MMVANHNHGTTDSQPKSSNADIFDRKSIINFGLIGASSLLFNVLKASAAEEADVPAEAVLVPAVEIPAVPRPKVDFGALKLPYDHVNYPLKDYLGKKATIVFNMKIDDPQTVLQFPDLVEIYKRYKEKGLNVLSFPTEQGWFEPDDDETVRAKSKEYYGFGDYPNAVVFDKVDILGPAANPLYTALTKEILTPNGYGRITLNYEKFLLDSEGQPVRRYPRKFSAYDMEPDLIALLEGNPLPAESPAFLKAWREAKREAQKSEYSFRYNYNYYTAPDSMYKLKPENDSK